jgi:hypothetical protein
MGIAGQKPYSQIPIRSSLDPSTGESPVSSCHSAVSGSDPQDF